MLTNQHIKNLNKKIFAIYLVIIITAIENVNLKQLNIQTSPTTTTTTTNNKEYFIDNYMQTEIRNNKIKQNEIFRMTNDMGTYDEESDVTIYEKINRVPPQIYKIIEISYLYDKFLYNKFEFIQLCNHATKLHTINLTENSFADYYYYTRKGCDFINLKYIKFSNNKFTSLKREQFRIFTYSIVVKSNSTTTTSANANTTLSGLTSISNQTIQTSSVEILQFDSNLIEYIQHDAFVDLVNLKLIDLSNNKLKYLHPLQFNYNYKLNLIDISSNLMHIFYKRHLFNKNSLNYFYINNNTIKCDCSLIELYDRSIVNKSIYVDYEFKCMDDEDRFIDFATLNRSLLDSMCQLPNISYDISELEASSYFSLLADWAHRWFTWYLWSENTIRVSEPVSYLDFDAYPSNASLLQQEEESAIQQQNFTIVSDANDTNQTISATTTKIKTKNKRDLLKNLYQYRLNDVKLKCEAVGGKPSPAIIWETNMGYFTNLDFDTSSKEYKNETKTEKLLTISDKTLQIFHKMSNLTQIRQKIVTSIGPYGSSSTNEIYINNDNELIITKLRQRLSGKISCLAINAAGVQKIDFEVHVRSGVGDYFFYSLCVSILSSVVPSIIGIIVCIICEHQAYKNYPLTPPIYPTPQQTNPTTPPNFDFNQWMSNAASNITGTLDQVSKKLRKGVEKASTTVRSIGVTSGAYIYSMYEHSTARLNTMKNYVPTLTVPTISLPTMKYSGQLATRMGKFRTGVHDYFVQFREFCGSSDLTHTASIATIASDTNASQAVGKASHIDLSLENYHLKYIAEENMDTENNDTENQGQ